MVNYETGKLYIDYHQDYANLARELDYCVVGTFPADVLWLANGQLFAVEEKKPSDLRSSVLNRRLQRELRGIVKMKAVGILGLRGTSTTQRINKHLWISAWGYTIPSRSLDAISEWMFYGRVVFIDKDPLLALNAYSELADKCAAVEFKPNILAGSDRQARKPGPTPFQEAMINLIKGIGLKASSNLEKKFGGDFRLAISSTPEEWGEVVHKGIVKRFKELVDIKEAN